LIEGWPGQTQFEGNLMKAVVDEKYGTPDALQLKEMRL
jgi:hypothetical protein